MLTALLGQNPYIFYQGETSLNTAIPFSVRLDGRTYAVDLRNYRRSSLATLRDAIVSTGQVDDSLFNTDGAWWRYRRNWQGGAGQPIMDLGDNRDARRFESSVGVDVWTEGELKLLPSCSLATANCDNDIIRMAVTESYVYILDSSGVYRSSNLTTWTQITVTGTPADVCSDGVDAYIVTSSKLYSVQPASTTATQILNEGGTRVWFVGNYLMFANNQDIHTVSTSGQKTTIMTHFQDSFAWTVAFAVGSKIYAGGHSGVKSEVYGFIIDNTGALVVGAEVAPMGNNELLLSATSHVGTVLFGTNLGIRLGVVSQDGTISYGPLIDDPGPVYASTSEGSFYWFGWGGIAANKSGVGRANLAITPAPLQPAFASDVYAEQGGTVTAVGRFNGKTLFAIGGHGVYVSSATAFVTSGTLRSGHVYYGTVENKSITDALVNFLPLDAGEQVLITINNDLGDEIEAVSGKQANQTTIDLQLDGEQGNYFEVVLELKGDGTSSPTVLYWRTRAFPIVPPVEQFVVPLLMYSKTVVNDGQGQLWSMDIQDELKYLIDAWRQKRPLTYIEGTSVRRVRLEAFEYQPHDWSDTLEGFEGTLTVRLVTL